MIKIQEIQVKIEQLQEELKKLQFEADAPIREKQVQQFLSSYSGKRLLEHSKLSDYGIWEVRGEDPNCDFAGSHHNPYIGTKEGTLKDVLYWAVDQSLFWTWGGGGEIKRVSVEKV